MGALRAIGSCALTALLMQGCTAVGPDYKPPHEPVPRQYSGAARAQAAQPPGSPRISTQEEPVSFWWQEFHDAELDKLIEQATAGNLNLKAAYLRIAEARIQVLSARAQGLPSLNASASYTREQLGLAGILKSKGIGTTGPTASSSAQALIGALEQPVNLYQLGFDASWEIDLFGKVRREVEAAGAQSAGAVESRNDLLLSLEAEVAQTYLQLRTGQALTQVTLDLIAAQRGVAELTQDRHEHGLAGEPDVDAARAQLTNLESQLPPYEQMVSTSKHALAVLIGQSPEVLDAEFGTTGALPPIPGDIPVGVPSTLARRRPDIRNAETALHAATAEVGVSVASLFPDVSLAGSYGLRNIGTRYLFDWQSHFYTIGPSVSIPLFHGGALTASVRLSRAQAAEAALNYRQTVLGALQEVEDGLDSLTQDAARIGSLKDTVGADQRAVDVQLDAYKHGVISYITLLTVQLQAAQARQQLVQAQSSEATDVVKLYKALGGGWEGAPRVTSAVQ
ncbi:MAG TPA: efflux transporter outer membrane subunit [Steroidobacteraceae bacterium]|nr:efflux transporter outer membrane subunit [Steroidobacteraceae bacterium]